ncbi:MAG: DUF4157 domain-containing protein, partial [Gemmataceae bacterium]|nr:DUF4157 domain-containing protein [Gemmataceae bacterium]
MASVRSATPAKAAPVRAASPVRPITPVVTPIRATTSVTPQVNPGSVAPIPSPTRTRLEASFGVNLSGVRVATGPGAAAAARAAQARAFAFGPQVVLGAGQRADDVTVMAHEVTHVIQQQAVPSLGRGPVGAGSGGVGAPAVRLGRSGRSELAPMSTALVPYTGGGVLQRWTPGGGDRFEAEANRAALAVSRSQPFRVVERTGAPQIQKLGLSDILDWIADKANIIPGFRMFTIIIGVNPINMSSVDRSPGNILRAVIEFVPGGGLITQALDNYGIFDKAGSWVAEQIATLGMVGGAFRDALMEFLDSLGWRDLFHPGDVWDRAKRIFTNPIDRVFDFLKGLVVGFVTLIKDAILRPLAKLAEGTRAWDLLIAVLGENPITGDKVPRTAETLIGGFLKLIGQDEVWENMKKANALGRAWAWFQSVLSGLLGFVSQIPTLAINAFTSL